jgi:PPOX class probable F420-dependent enzyme
MTLAMSRAEREAFLAETHVAVLSVAEEGRAPLIVPVWYDYEPGGDIRIATGPQSRKVADIKRTGRASLCVQTEAPPYVYVTVEGPATFGKPDYERDIRRVALRYLGPEMGEVYLKATAADNAAAVLLSIRPARWASADFRKWSA